MSSPPQLRLDRQLCFALYAASRAMTNVYGSLLAPLGLTYPQYIVMLVLWEKDGATVSELGARLDLDSGTLTPLLKRMEAAGLVKRARDEEDERVVHANLTAKGKALQAKAMGVPAAIACKVGGDLKDVGRLRDELAALTKSLRAANSAEIEGKLR